MVNRKILYLSFVFLCKHDKNISNLNQKKAWENL